MLTRIDGQHMFEHIENLSAEVEGLKIRLRHIEQKRHEAIAAYNKWVEEWNASVAEWRKKQEEWRARDEAWKKEKKEQRQRRRNMTPEEKVKEKEMLDEQSKKWRHYQKVKKQIIFYERTRRAERSL